MRFIFFNIASLALTLMGFAAYASAHSKAEDAILVNDFLVKQAGVPYEVLIIAGIAALGFGLVVYLTMLRTQVRGRTHELKEALDRIQTQNEDLEREIKERSELEDTLQKARTEYLTIFDSVPAMIWYLDRKNHVIRANQAAARYMKIPVEKLAGKSMFELFGDKATEFFRGNAAVMKDGMPKFGEKYSYINPMGEERWIEMSKIPFYDEKSTIDGIIIVAEDITTKETASKERESLIAELQEALTKIKTLKGLIPICSHCKKIRDDKGFWNKIETYISEHSDAEFSHGICPECMKEIYPEYAKKQKINLDELDDTNNEGK